MKPTLLKLAWTAGVLLAAARCGPGSGSQSPGTAAVEAESPMPAALPSRSLAFDHFALEGAVGSQLSDAEGVDGEASTTWALHGDSVELQMEVSTGLSREDAEGVCQSSAGDAVAPSLALGTPSWTTPSSVYVTQGASCIQVTVFRVGGQQDLAAAGAVASLLVTADAI